MEAWHIESAEENYNVTYRNNIDEKKTTEVTARKRQMQVEHFKATTKHENNQQLFKEFHINGNQLERQDISQAVVKQYSSSKSNFKMVQPTPIKTNS